MFSSIWTNAFLLSNLELLPLWCSVVTWKYVRFSEFFEIVFVLVKFFTVVYRGVRSVGFFLFNSIALMKDGHFLKFVVCLPLQLQHLGVCQRL